uniref:C-type lectin domain-containing protein n=1 Tax=Periophthalmus magnuspinnatus TaxID=409849 RepID=A0A3B4BBI7_9GOBI
MKTNPVLSLFSFCSFSVLIRAQIIVLIRCGYFHSSQWYIVTQGTTSIRTSIRKAMPYASIVFQVIFMKIILHKSVHITEHSLSQTQVLTMTGAILLFLLFMDFYGILGKNIYISLSKTWTQAQNLCRTHHTDLSFAYSEEDHERILNAGQGNKEGWIGLHRDSENAFLWLCSGGGRMTFENWDNNQPDNIT